MNSIEKRQFESLNLFQDFGYEIKFDLMDLSDLQDAKE